MKYEKEIAKNGQWTLKVNGRYIYSKYNPKREAARNINAEFNKKASSYLLIGLGFGYHLEALCELMDKKKSVQVVMLEEYELELFNSIKSSFCFIDYHIKIIKINEVELYENLQIIIPQVWMNTIEEKHPLYFNLADIKMKQVTYKKSASQMYENFSFNSSLGNFNLPEQKEFLNQKFNACLVASGPSLKETVHWLKEQRDKVYILCVGSALDFLLGHGVIPDAVIILDPKNNISHQINSEKYKGLLFYLSTANYQTIELYPYKKIILLQEGYDLAEQLAENYAYPLLETGGSVGTIGFSLLEYLGFSNIYLFGQDLGFLYDNTHVVGSTSGRVVSKNEKLIQLPSNNGGYIQTTLNLLSYLRWFERKFSETNVNVFNTAYNGAEISYTKLIDYEEYINLIMEY